MLVGDYGNALSRAYVKYWTISVDDKGQFINDVITFEGYPDPPPLVRVTGEKNCSATK